MRTQPETSQEAKNLKTNESKQKDYDRIIEAFMGIGNGHYEDVANWLEIKDLNVVSRRLKEMRDMGLLENTGKKKKTSRDRNAFVHKLAEGWDKPKKRISKKKKPKPIDQSKVVTVRQHTRNLKKPQEPFHQQKLFDL